MEKAMAVGWPRRLGRGAPHAQRLTEEGLAAQSLGALRVGVLVLDAADRPVLANPAAVELGLVREMGPTRGAAPAPQVHAVVRTLAGQVRGSGVSREVELDLPRTGRRLTGEPSGVHIRVVPLADVGYGPGHVAVEASDVTEAHRVNRVRRDFVANVSHELKTPVGALALLAETLLEASDDPQAARRFAERIHHESHRLARLVTELLELSRLQGAEPLPQPLPVGVDRIITEVFDRSRTAASAKSIAVVFSGTRGLTVYGDEGQLVTAVTNLVENAIAYSPEQTTVTVTAERVYASARSERQRAPQSRAKDDASVEIRVIDEGIGIAAKDLDRIFERFYRADQARSRVTGGTGLGLAIVKHIAVNHGGRVEVSSAPGEGSTFTLRLPGRPPEATLGLPPGIEIDEEADAS